MSASLTVKIAADLNSFSKTFNKMTKDVTDAANRIADVGKVMTLSITAPVVAGAAAMAKFAIEAQDSAARMASFGGEATRMGEVIESIKRQVPETSSSLQVMAANVADMGRGMGMGAQQSANLAASVLAMSTNLAHSSLVQMPTAVEAITGALEGNTKGLRSLGVVLNEAQIKQQAYKLGLLGVHQELTPLGTALSTYALLLQQASLRTGDAGKFNQLASTQVRELWVQVQELGESFAGVLLPPLRFVVGVTTEFIKVISEAPGWIKGTILVIGGLAAGIGPTIVAVTKLTEAMVALRAAMKLAAEADLLAKFAELGTWLAAPEVRLALGALAILIAGVAYLWHKFRKEAETPIKPAVPDSLQSIMGGGGATGQDTRNPLQEFQQHSAAIQTSFDQQVKSGEPMVNIVAQIVSLNTEALKLYDAQTDKLNDMALAARNVWLQTRQIMAVQNVARATTPVVGATNPTSGFSDAVKSAAGVQASMSDLNLGALQDQINAEIAIRKREITINLPDTFDAVRVAALTMKESFRAASDGFKLSLTSFKMQWSGSNMGASALAGLQQGASQVLGSFTPMALAATAISKIMQGLQPVLDAVMGPLVALGQILGQIAGPILRVTVFPSLKSFGIIVALIGEGLYSVAAGVTHAFGELIKEIGVVVAHIPFLGSVGRGIENFADNILTLGTSLQGTAKQLDQSRIQLQNLNFNDAADGLTTLASSANAAAAALTNVPAAFKINLAKYRATDFYTGPYVMPLGARSADSSAGASYQIVMDGRAVGQLVVNRMRNSASRQFGSSSRITDVVVVN